MQYLDETWCSTHDVDKSVTVLLTLIESNYNTADLTSGECKVSFIVSPTDNEGNDAIFTLDGDDQTLSEWYLPLRYFIYGKNVYLQNIAFKNLTAAKSDFVPFSCNPGDTVSINDPCEFKLTNFKWIESHALALVGNHDGNNYPTKLTADNITIYNNSDFESLFSFSSLDVKIRDSTFELNNCESHMIGFYDYSNDKQFSGNVLIENVTFSENGNSDLLKANIYIGAKIESIIKNCTFEQYSLFVATPSVVVYNEGNMIRLENIIVYGYYSAVRIADIFIGGFLMNSNSASLAIVKNVFGAGTDISFYNRGRLTLDNVYVYSFFDYTTTLFGEYNALIVNEFSGIVSVKNCTFMNSLNTIVVRNYGTFDIDSVWISHGNYSFVQEVDSTQDIGIANYGEATLTITNSWIEFFDKGIQNYGTVDISECELNGNVLGIESSFVIGATPELTIRNVLFNAPSAEWYEYRSGQYEFDFNRPQFINANDSKVTITNCTFSGSASSVVVGNNTEMTMEGCVIMDNTQSSSYHGVYFGGGSTNQVIGCNFTNNIAFAVYAAQESYSCLFANRMEGKALYIEENGAVYSCVYDNPTTPSGSCNTAFGSLNNKYADLDGTNIFSWNYDLYGDTSSYSLNAPIITFGDLSLHDSIFKCHLSDTSIIDGNETIIEEYSDSACNDVNFMYIFGGFARLVDLSLDNNVDIIIDGYVCQRDCHITESSGDYLVFQQAEISCNGISTVDSIVLFLLEFEFTTDLLATTDEYSDGVIDAMTQIFFDARGFEVQSLNVSRSESTHSVKPRLMLQDSSYLLRGDIFIYYNDQDAATAVANITANSNFSSGFATALENSVGMKSGSIGLLYYSSDGGNSDSMQQEAAALIISATTGVAYSVGLVDGDKYNLTQYLLNIENGWEDANSNIGIVDAFDAYPGDELNFWIAVVDENDNIIDPKEFDETIYVTISETENVNINEEIEVVYDTKALHMETIKLTSTNIDQFGETFNLTLTVEDLLLRSTTVDLHIKTCPPGYGVSGSQCAECEAGFYTLINNTYQCKKCPNSDGIDCNGGTEVVIATDWWHFADEYGNLSVVDCPQSFCCQLIQGCNLFDNKDDFCAKNRDNDLPLCGGCIDGFSEVFMGSTGCAQCKHNQMYWIAIPLFLCICFVLYVTFNQKQDRNDTTYVLPPRKVIKIALLKNLAYFYQILNLTFPRGVVVYMQPVLTLFSLSLDTSSTDEPSRIFCLYPGMGPLMKASLNFFFPLMAYVVLFAIRLINPTTFLGKEPRYTDAFCQITLMSLGSIVRTALKLTECRPIDGHGDVVFYAGSADCPGFTWFMSIFILFVVFIGFCLVWYLLKTMAKRRRRYDIHPLISLTDPFEENIWWWEFVLISRRISLAVLGLFLYLDPPLIEFCMIVVVIICLWCQSWYTPFRNSFNDALEVFCLICLLVILSAVFSNDLVDRNGPFISILATICIIFPIIFVLIYAIYAYCGAKIELPNGLTVEEAMHLVKQKSTPYGVRKAIEREINSDNSSVDGANGGAIVDSLDDQDVDYTDGMHTSLDATHNSTQQPRTPQTATANISEDDESDKLEQDEVGVSITGEKNGRATIKKQETLSLIDNDIEAAAEL